MLHDAKNDLAAAMLLLGRMRAGHAVDPTVVETLIRRAAVRLDDIPDDVPSTPELLPRVVRPLL